MKIQSDMHNKGSNVLALILVSLTLTYGFFQGRALIDGPILTVHAPLHGETVTTALFEITGDTRNVTHLSINGRTITMDTEGNFHETLITPHGYGVLLVEASNRFGHHRVQRVEFYGNPENHS